LRYRILILEGAFKAKKITAYFLGGDTLLTKNIQNQLNQIFAIIGIASFEGGG